MSPSFQLGTAPSKRIPNRYHLKEEDHSNPQEQEFESKTLGKLKVD